LVVLLAALLAVVAFVARVRAAGAFAAIALAAAVLVAAVLVGVFGAGLAAAGLVSLGAGAAPRTMSLKPLRGVMRAFLDALILMAAPVAGLRPMRALVWILANLAKPLSTTGSPLVTVAHTTSVKPRSTASTVFGSASLWAAMAVMFIFSSSAGGLIRRH
jgi:hypothetical protein